MGSKLSRSAGGSEKFAELEEKKVAEFDVRSVTETWQTMHARITPKHRSKGSDRLKNVIALCDRAVANERTKDQAVSLSVIFNTLYPHLVCTENVAKLIVLFNYKFTHHRSVSHFNQKEREVLAGIFKATEGVGLETAVITYGRRGERIVIPGKRFG